MELSPRALLGDAHRTECDALERRVRACSDNQRQIDFNVAIRRREGLERVSTVCEEGCQGLRPDNIKGESSRRRDRLSLCLHDLLL